MKITLLCVGRTEYPPFREATDRYLKRIPHYVPIEYVELPDIKTTKSLTEQKQKEQEGKTLLSKLNNSDYVVLLDERGREYTSRQFSEFIQSKMVCLPGRLVFVVGGPYGFSEEVYSRANSKLSLSKMTFPHELVRLFFVEQIYRAMTIMRGEPYHHD